MAGSRRHPVRLLTGGDVAATTAVTIATAIVIVTAIVTVAIQDARGNKGGTGIGIEVAQTRAGMIGEVTTLAMLPRPSRSEATTRRGRPFTVAPKGSAETEGTVARARERERGRGRGREREPGSGPGAGTRIAHTAASRRHPHPHHRQTTAGDMRCQRGDGDQGVRAYINVVLD